MKQLMQLEADLGLQKYYFLKKMIQRVRLLTGEFEGRDGQILSRNHQTLLSLPNTIVKLLNSLAGRSADKKKSCPIVDANEMQRLGVALPYLFDSLCQREVELFNKKMVSAAKTNGKRLNAKRDRLWDSSIGIVQVCEDYLCLYSNFRCVMWPCYTACSDRHVG